jgi:Na+-driven multidrug efflux pump
MALRTPAVYLQPLVGVESLRRLIAGLFSLAEGVVAAASGYFYARGLVYGFMAAFAMLFSAYQGWGQATAPLLVSLLRVAIV